MSELAERFVDAVTRVDLDALCVCLAPGARFWVNIGPSEYSADERLAVLELERQNLREHRAEDVRITATDEGFIAQLTSIGTTTRDESMRVAVCLIASVADDLITRVDEYADSAAAAPLIRAIYG
ncbi:MAG: nuclear transport factor 2 family protein [Acidimicrobiia bacterium]